MGSLSKRWCWSFKKFLFTPNQSCFLFLLSEGNGEWCIEKTYLEVYSGKRPMSFQEFSFIKYTLIIERQWFYYAMFLVLPCVICTVLVLFSFALPPENGERIGFCSTIMVSVSVFLLLIADMLPEKSDNLPILGIYYTITMVEIACVLVATILVLRAYHSTSEPPACCRALYRMFNKKRKKKILNITETKFKMKRLMNRNAIDSELTRVENNTESVSPPSRPESEHPPIKKNESEPNDEENRKIWRAIAVSFDRLFFWLFLLTFLASSAYIIESNLRIKWRIDYSLDTIRKNSIVRFDCCFIQYCKMWNIISWNLNWNRPFATSYLWYKALC